MTFGPTVPKPSPLPSAAAAISGVGGSPAVWTPEPLPVRAAAVGVPAFLRKWPCGPARRRWRAGANGCSAGTFSRGAARPTRAPQGANKASLCAAECPLSVVWGPEAQGRAVTEAGRGAEAACGRTQGLVPRVATRRRGRNPAGSPGRSLFLAGSGPASGYCAVGRGPAPLRDPAGAPAPRAASGPPYGASDGETGSAVGARSRRRARRRRRAGSDPGPRRPAPLASPPHLPEAAKKKKTKTKKSKASTRLAESGPARRRLPREEAGGSGSGEPASGASLPCPHRRPPGWPARRTSALGLSALICETGTALPPAGSARPPWPVLSWPGPHRQPPRGRAAQRKELGAWVTPGHRKGGRGRFPELRPGPGGGRRGRGRPASPCPGGAPAREERPGADLHPASTHSPQKAQRQSWGPKHAAQGSLKCTFIREESPGTKESPGAPQRPPAGPGPSQGEAGGGVQWSP